MPKVPQLDLTRYIRTVADEWTAAVRDIALSGKILNGPHKQGFEKEFASYLGVPRVLGVASGTDAIALCLRALGVGPGDEVITHANAFIADIEPIIALGATPVLVDMSETDYGPDVEAIRGACTEKTKAIFAVHLLGMPCDIDGILAVGRERNISLIEDASQAQGALYKGKKVGTFGAINAFSLGPVKNLSTIGDAGCIATASEELFEKVKILAVHGQVKKYKHAVYGTNSRLDEVHAAYLRIGLRTLDERNSRRREIYARYRIGLVRLPISFMPDFSDRVPVFHQAVIRTEKRDELQAHLKEREIDTGIYYPDALHEQEAWLAAGFLQGSFPRAEKYARENLALPMFAELADEEIEYVIESVKSFFGK